MPDDPLLVTIVGFPHSGSTLLGDVLASAPGAMHLGETAVLFRRLIADETRVCSCGSPLSTSAVWGPVLATIAAVSGRAPLEILRDTQAVVLGKAPRPYLADVYRLLLEQLIEQSQARYVVDSSNWPAYGAFLRDCFVGRTAQVHLVRDPRAALYSRLRKAQQRRLAESSRGRTAASVLRDATRWNAWNRHARQRGSGPSGVVRYEDFCDDPQRELARVSAATAWPAVSVAADATVVRARSHVLWGNRRAVPGRAVVKLDDRWRSDAPTWHGRVAWEITRRERRRYGYSESTAP